MSAPAEVVRAVEAVLGCLCWKPSRVEVCAEHHDDGYDPDAERAYWTDRGCPVAVAAADAAADALAAPRKLTNPAAIVRARALIAHLKERQGSLPHGF